MVRKYIAWVLALGTFGFGGAVLRAQQDPVHAVGKDGLTLKGQVRMDDPKIKVVVAPGKTEKLPAKRFLVKLMGGKCYRLTMASVVLDSLLVVQDAAGKQMAFDDDSGGSLDAELTLDIPKDGTYQVYTASLKGAGAFTLQVRQVGAQRDQGTAERRKQLAAKWNELCNATLHLLRKGKLPEATKAAKETVAVARELYPEAEYPKGHANLALSLNNLGFSLQTQGQFTAAEPFYRHSLAMNQRLYPKADHPQLANSLNNLGTLLQAQRKLVDAEPYFRDSLAMYLRMYLKADHPNLIHIMNNLGSLLHSLGKHAEAEPLVRDALAMHLRLYGKADQLEVANRLDKLGTLLYAQGKHAAAEPYFRDALAMRQRLYPKADHLDLTHSLNNLGVLLKDQGQYSAAEPLLRDAVAMVLRLYPKTDHPDVALSLNNLSSLLQAQGQYAAAEPLLRDSLAMWLRLHPQTDHPDVAGSLNNLGSLLQAQGRYAAAEPLLRNALAMRQRLFPKADHPDLALSLNNLGGFLQAQGQHAAAERYYRDALAMNERLYPKVDHPELALSLNNLGGLLQVQGQHAAAEPLLRDALAMYRRLGEIYAAAKSEGEALTRLGVLPLTRGRYLSNARLGNRDPAATYAEIWATKAALARVFENRHLAARAAATDPKTATLLSVLAAARRSRAELLLAPYAADPATRKQRAEDLKFLVDRVAELEAALRPRLPAVPRAEKLAAATPADLQKALPADAAVVDFLGYTFFEQDPKKPGRAGMKFTRSYLAFVLTRNKITQVELGSAEPLEKNVRLWREAITGQAKQVPADIPAKVRELVWEKVRKEFPKGVKTIYLAPDLALTALPWAALPGDQPGTILLEDFALAVIPHAPFLLDKLRPDEPLPGGVKSSGVLVVGGVAYDEIPANLNSQTFLRSSPALAKDKPLAWKGLPGAEAEARGVEKLASVRKLPNRLLTGKGASGDAVLAALPQARFVHLATHGFFADKEFRSALQVDPKLFEMRGNELVGAGALSPMVLTGLVLAGANKADTPGRGLLTGELLIDRDLSSLDLAVLSACETGLGDKAGGEGVFGLQRAFHVAGARNVAVSLWKVDDQATAALMAVFYKELWDNGQPPIEALRRAQLAIYRNPGKIPALAQGLRGKFKVVSGSGSDAAPAVGPAGRAHPRLWAAFILSGPGTLSPARKEKE